MESAITPTLLGSILGLGVVLLQQWLSGKQSTGTTGTNGSVTDGETAAVTDDAAYGVDPPWGHAVLDVLRGSVRPVITYGFFGLFVLVKLTALFVGFFIEHATVRDLLPILWDEGTVTLFATVLAFWFGSRLMGRWKR